MRWLALLLLTACGGEATADAPTQEATAPKVGQAEAIFAGGCFWCMEPAFDEVPGVLETWSGYTGGPEVGPTYRAVAGHSTGHVEALRVVYDPQQVDYGSLLNVFWRNIDPTQDDGQFCDRGAQYRSAIFVSDPTLIKLAEASKKRTQTHLGVPVVTEIRPSAPFWVAEAYHQDFYKKNPSHYYRYRKGCGRDVRLQQLWSSTP
jgi:peptide-methionine (S)-S-oxide reductase